MEGVSEIVGSLISITRIDNWFVWSEISGQGFMDFRNILCDLVNGNNGNGMSGVGAL